MGGAREYSPTEQRARDAFEAFAAGREVGEITAAFEELQCSLAALPCDASTTNVITPRGGDGGGGVVTPRGHEASAVEGRVNSATLLHLLSALSSLLPHKSRQLLIALEKRSQRVHYQPGAHGLRAAIIGAGPVGLRTAIELALLGIDVQVLESRGAFVRLQVLHLWDWVEQDLIELGIKLLDPSIFAAADFKHVGTAQLQHSLLKVALLLGVRVRFHCKVCACARPSSGPSHRLATPVHTFSHLRTPSHTFSRCVHACLRCKGGRPALPPSASHRQRYQQ